MNCPVYPVPPPMDCTVRRGRQWRLRLVGLFGVFALPVTAAEYHVSPRGDDQAVGSAEQPWRTLGKVNSTLQPGDIAIFHAGDYDGAIDPERSGKAGAPIIYRAAEREAAVILGQPELGENGACVRLMNRQHIEIDGFALLPVAGRLMHAEGSRHLAVRRSRLENASLAWESILMRDVQHSRFEELRAGRTMRIGGNWGHVTGNLWDVYASSHLVFQRIHFHRTGHHSLGLWHDSHDIVIRECVFDGIWGRNFEFASPIRLLVEQCVITQAFDGANSADSRAKFLARDAIFRHNLVHHNYGGPLAATVWDPQDFFPKLALRRTRIYHNTYADNYEETWGFGQPQGQRGQGQVSDNVFQNENFAFNGLGGVETALKVRMNTPSSNEFRSSNFFNGTAGAATIGFSPGGVPGTPTEAFARTPGEANAVGSVRFVGSLAVDPAFVDRANDDYRLSPGSPLIDAGQPLARTTHAGSGRIIPVDDAAWFYDGYGIEGEVGDLIVLGADQQPARVVSVDPEFSTVTVDRDLSWEEGETVTLPYAGAAPDIGAYEAGAEHEAWYRAPREWRETRILTMATAEEVVVRTTFEPEELEDWFMFWNFTRRVNSTARLDETTAGGGRRSVRIEATGPGATLGADIRPAEWLIDRFPTVRFKYRIPPGTPVGLWLVGFRDTQRVCIGGTATRRVVGEVDLGLCTLVDDDAWHEVELDARLIRQVHPDIDVLFALEFYTHMNGAENDRFWFDDFVILPAAPAHQP